MTDLTRRSFLRGALTVAAVSIAPVQAWTPNLPRIVGDGIHDDTLGLQAAFDGKPFLSDGVVVADGAETLWLRGGIYRLTKGLHIWAKPIVHIRDATFNLVSICHGGQPDSVLTLHTAFSSWLEDVHIEVSNDRHVEDRRCHLGADQLPAEVTYQS